MRFTCSDRRARNAGLLIAALTAILVGPGCSKSEPTPTGPGAASDLPVWQPDPVLLGELQEPVRVGDYTVRVPKGYAKNVRDTPDGLTVILWQAPPPSPRLFTVVILRTFEGEPAKTAAEMRTKPKPSSGLIDWVESAVETGIVDSATFEKVTTTCTAAKTGRKLRGFQYTSGGKTAVEINYQGAAEDEQSFKVAEAAARTFRRAAGEK